MKKIKLAQLLETLNNWENIDVILVDDFNNRIKGLYLGNVINVKDWVEQDSRKFFVEHIEVKPVNLGPDFNDMEYIILVKGK